MGRSVMLSNGHMLVGLDESGLVHDFYYPYVGLDNLTTSRSAHHNIGVWVNDKFSWLDKDGGWNINTTFEDDALISDIAASNQQLGVELKFKDFIDAQYTAFCRRITVTNKSDQNVEVRLFMHQVFQISRAGRGDTALYVPSGNYILDYKGRCLLLIYAQNETGQAFDQFAVGGYAIEGKEGTFRDAEDGELSGNLVEHGGVDSTVRCVNHLAPNESKNINYWVIAAESQFDAEIVHRVLQQQGLPKRIDATRAYWNDWLGVGSEKLSHVEEKYKALTKKSMMIIKAHTDRHGGIIASCDSSIYNYGRDYYSYVWPRDAALSILPLIKMGYKQEPQKLFEFCSDTIHPGGYMMHKYQPDKAIGSTWHPLLHQHHQELAIQEDETAAVVYAIGEYVEAANDIALAKQLYSNFIKPAADFMAYFIDKATGLPHASYDLWEQKFATHTYTVAITVAALKVAADIAQQLDKNEDSEKWLAASRLINSNIQKLYNTDQKYYRKSSLLLEDGSLTYDETLDVSSVYSVMRFGDIQQEHVDEGFKTIEEKILNACPIGGVPRYSGDGYFLARKEYIGNPWLIATLWMAQYYIKTEKIDKARELIDWVAARASGSGMLSEQADPVTGYGIGVSPLVWSHATFIETVLMLSEATFEA